MILLVSKSSRCRPPKVVVRERATYAWQETPPTQPLVTTQRKSMYAFYLLMKLFSSAYCCGIICSAVDLVATSYIHGFFFGIESPWRRTRLISETFLHQHAGWGAPLSMYGNIQTADGRTVPHSEYTQCKQHSHYATGARTPTRRFSVQQCPLETT